MFSRKHSASFGSNSNRRRPVALRFESLENRMMLTGADVDWMALTAPSPASSLPSSPAMSPAADTRASFAARGLATQIIDSADWDANGVTDSINTTTNTYDSKGNLTQRIITEDYNGDGIAEFISSLRLSWNSTGFDGVYEEDYGGDHVIDFRSFVTYSTTRDRGGYTFSRYTQADDNVDGIIDGIFLRSSSIDNRGRLIARTIMSDYGADGVVDLLFADSWSYDKQGNLAFSTEITEYGPSYKFESHTSYVYDGKGNLVASMLEGTYNGVVNDRESYVASYDASGHVLASKYDVDYGVDGVIDYEEVYSASYDAHGNLLSESFVDANQITWKTRTFAYDSKDQLIASTEVLDFNGNGLIDDFDERTERAFSYDSKGHLVATDSKFTLSYDGVVYSSELHFTYAYATNGALIGETVTDYAVATWVWDKQGNLLSLTTEDYYEYDGVHYDIVFADLYRYDRWGNLSSTTTFFNGDAVHTISYVYG